jgi:hypothetical protein
MSINKSGYDNSRIVRKIMDMFGIRVAGNGEPDEFYVGNDAVLWDWLMADDYEPSPRSDLWLIVEAPVGYRFHYDNLFPEAELMDADEMSRYSLVMTETARADKAHFLLETLRSVEPVEFYSLGLDKSRILDVAPQFKR